MSATTRDSTGLYLKDYFDTNTLAAYYKAGVTITYDSTNKEIVVGNGTSSYAYMDTGPYNGSTGASQFTGTDFIFQKPGLKPSPLGEQL